MKTFKTTILLTGIIVGIVAIFSHHSIAGSTENKSNSEQEQASLFQQELKHTEFELIESYLKQNPVEEETPQQVYIYTVEGECIYKGEKENAMDLVNQGDYLFEKGKVTYYIIVN